MANRRIKDLDERTTLSSGDYIATDNINGTRKVEVTKITNPINQVTQKVSNASDAYSETKAYKVGDIVIQNNTLYVCDTACSAASWAVNQNNFTASTVASELGNLNSALTIVDYSYSGQTTHQSSGTAYTDTTKSGFEPGWYLVESHFRCGGGASGLVCMLDLNNTNIFQNVSSGTNPFSHVIDECNIVHILQSTDIIKLYHQEYYSGTQYDCTWRLHITRLKKD